MTYNALDIATSARALREQLIIEMADIDASMAYAYATDQCDDCPNREPREPQSYEEKYFPRPPAAECCKENGAWEEWNAGGIQHSQKITELLKALTAYLGDKNG